MSKRPRQQRLSGTNFQPPRRTCGGKVQYSTEYKANQAAEEMMILKPELQLDVYKCMGCSGWHLTRRKVDIF